MDILLEHYEEYISHLYHASCKIVKRDTSVCFYNYSNYYFEIESDDEDYVDEITGETIKGLRKFLNIKSGITPVKLRDSATLFLFNCRIWDSKNPEKFHRIFSAKSLFSYHILFIFYTKFVFYCESWIFYLSISSSSSGSHTYPSSAATLSAISRSVRSARMLRHISMPATGLTAE